MVVGREGRVSDFSPSEEVSRRSQILTSMLLGEHDVLARSITRIHIMASDVKLCQFEASLPTFWVNWIHKPAGQGIFSGLNKENSQVLYSPFIFFF